MPPKMWYAVAAGGSAICAALLLIVPAEAQDSRREQVLAARSLTELRSHDDRVRRMVRSGELRLREVRADKLVPGRTVERADQMYRGVRVFGGDICRQLSRGQTVSVFGTLYDGIDVDPDPEIEEPQARAIVEARSGQRLGPFQEGELGILPLERGGFALAWKVRVALPDDVRLYFVDAHTGAIVFDYSDLQTQNVVGRGTGVLNDSKKIAVQSGSGTFTAQDGLRPPSIRTYDMQGNPSRAVDVLNGRVTLAVSDLASDADNVWADGATVDAHVYSGWTYDYYFKRYGRRGLNDANLPMRSLVHPARRSEFFVYSSTYPIFFANAAYYGNGYVVYGVGLPANVLSGGRTWNFVSGALDIVGHELTHGVTQYTSNLIYLNEPGALNEAFSDIMGTAVEFFYQPAGEGLLRADYLVGEDVVRGVTNPNHGIRSMAAPTVYGHPDHYSIRFLGSFDNGGVHINSGIANHAFYLAIEGGTHRLSGLSVQGVGSANREQVERVFYRAFTQLMTSNTNFAVARAATIQAARDLYGAGSAPERAVTEAWTAVGVN